MFPVQVRCKEFLLHLIVLTSVSFSSHHLFFVPCLSPILNDISIIIHLFYLVMWKQSESNLRFLFYFFQFILSSGRCITQRMCFQIIFFQTTYFKNLFIFYWRIIALQNFAVFCQTSIWISHRYTYIPSLLNFPLIPPLYFDAEPPFEFPEPDSKFLLAIYFTYCN